jgi:hypothetical protein
VDIWIARLTATFPPTHSPAQNPTILYIKFNFKTHRSDSYLDWNLLGDLERYANSKSMISSLNNALLELKAIQNLLAIVDDKRLYAHVDKAYSLPRNREKSLPKDEAHMAFKSHYARLNNLDRSRLNDEEKEIIDARKGNIWNAGKLYAQRQAHTLGIEPE